MRHDYDHPPEWPAMTPAEKAAWYTQERARRQALRQRTAYAERYETAQRRATRRLNARSGVTLGDE